MKPEIRIAQTKSEWITTTADQIIALAASAIETRGEFSLVLSGGRTPRPIYQHLSSISEQIDWQRMTIFWSDERCVPPGDSESNYRMAKESLLDQVPVQSQNIFRMLGEIEPEDAAQDYEEMLAAFFYNKEKRFDLILLGIGKDGHTASLFPETDALDEVKKWVTTSSHPDSDSTRLTLTYPALNAARQVIFLASGKSKATVVTDVIHNPDVPPAYPAKRVTGQDKPPMWILDADAASKV